jgi:hypothetical protein
MIVKYPERYLTSLGLGLCLSTALTYCFASFLMILGGSLNQVSATGILLLSVGATIWTVSRNIESLRERVLIGTGVIAFLLLSALISGLILDVSIDGQNYHYQGVSLLAHGWNPFHETIPTLPDTPGMPASVWTAHYPIASWVVIATQHAAGLPLESSKGLGISLLLGSGFLTAGILRSAGFGFLVALAVGILAAANPVSTGQLFTRMNDGILASLFLAIIMLAVSAVYLRSRAALIYMLPLMILTLNLKFSAVPILVALCGFICVAAWFLQGPRKALVTAGYLAAAGTIGIFVIGFAPYGRNLFMFGHPFYPLMGTDGAYDIMTSNTPAFIEPLGHFGSFFRSLLSETHSGYGETPALKVPFTLSPSEIRAAGGPDVRIAGFGPLFSGAILVALGTGIAAAAINKRQRLLLGALIVAAALLGLALIFPQNWWARYVPYLWLVPVCVALAALASNDVRFKAAGLLLVGVLGANAGLVGLSSAYLSAKWSADASRQIAQLSNDNAVYEIQFDLALSRSELKREAGVRFNTVPELTRDACASTEEIAAFGPDRTGGVICRLQDQQGVLVRSTTSASLR